MYFTFKTVGFVASFYTHNNQGKALVSLAIRAGARHYVINLTRQEFERIIWLAAVLYLMS